MSLTLEVYPVVRILFLGCRELTIKPMIPGVNPQWDRIVQVMFYIGETKISSFARRLGFGRAETFYQIKRGNIGISLKLAQKIVDWFPELNREWLMFGSGSMLISQAPERPIKPEYQDDEQQSGRKTLVYKLLLIPVDE